MALAAARSAWTGGRPFSLALIDSEMPDLDGWAVARKIREECSPTPEIVMMLTSLSCQRNPGRLRERGKAGHLLKPIGQFELVEAIQAALGNSRPAVSEPQSEGVVSESRSKPRDWKVLVAEDNPVNQILIARTLERVGCSATIVPDGEKAVRALEERRFDAILMDVQMPVMDGFKATALIRDQERESGTRVPIIALTAHAIVGYREQCLQAGMDEYVAKPIDPRDLLAKLDSLITNA